LPILTLADIRQREISVWACIDPVARLGSVLRTDRRCQTGGTEMNALMGHTFGTHAGMSALTKAARLLAGIRVAERMTGCEVDDMGMLPCPACSRPFNVRNGGQIDHVEGKAASGSGTYVGGGFVLICASCNQTRGGMQGMGAGVDFHGVLSGRYGRDVKAASVGVPYVGGTVARRLLAAYVAAPVPTNQGNVGRQDAEAFANYRTA
jgi:hypothetical protein